jgi:hypothetical protein
VLREQLRPFSELRPRWQQAWDAVCLWPGEQIRRGRKPDPQGFAEWAGLWIELGAALCAPDRCERDPAQTLGVRAAPCPRERLTRAARSGVRAFDAAALLLLLS